ncbi:hypothetical protein CEXT_732401 [Caerostris extrusa]|uniref:Uncharacterized protein n=1 Tax=Caerostris extrusa TaxID=172846 RepID=A0AAV4PQU8_CAEEX|nr:hypothetical protein CEXT_732401 [Caerostris extrusa]
MSPLILRESDQKIDRATRKKKYETARRVEEESSVQHTGHWKKKEKGMLGNRWREKEVYKRSCLEYWGVRKGDGRCYSGRENYYAYPPPRFQLNWRRNRTFLAAFQTELELRLR